MSLNPIQERIKAQLEQNLYFTTPIALPVVTVDQGDIGNLIEQAVSKLGGVAVSILTPFGQNQDQNSSAVNLDLEIEISASEIWVINRGASGLKKPSYEVIRKIIATWRPDNQGGLHFWKPGPPFTRLEFKDFDEVSFKTKAATILTYRAIFGVKEMLP